MAVNWAKVELILLILGLLATVLILLSHYFEAKRLSEGE